MSQGKTFFQTEITDQFVKNLDNSTFCELFSVLRQNFLNEMKEAEMLKRKQISCKQDIQAGIDNLQRLKEIQKEHAYLQNKYKLKLTQIDTEIQQLKKQLRAQ